MPKVKNIRDLTLVELDSENILVIACDSLGAIGSKAADRVATSGKVVGRCTVRVPLLEIMAAGAVPLVIINTLSVEMDPTGKEILQGISQELEVSGLTDVTVTGSTEENMPTVQTGVGITVIGKASAATLRLGRARAGDIVYCVGKPKVGTEVLTGPLPDVPLLEKLLQQAWVHEILPVGSKGVLDEARQLATTAGYDFHLAADPGLDVHKSAGPATSLLVAASTKAKKKLQELTSLDVYQVGTIKSVTLAPK
ncbi:MAG: hypothetical protein GX197_10075 [Firmicutes bacterium]|mgnify:CR=1 FL=1|nr:hypothetical protein [Bacillota bacterium]